MASSAVPTIPLVMFGILEPIVIWLGSYIILSDPLEYVLNLAPGTPKFLSTHADATKISAIQAANMYALWAAIQVMCCWTTDTRIIKGWFTIVAVGDLFHLYSYYHVLGPAVCFDTSRWNFVLWQIVIATGIAFPGRIATLLGLFGKIEAPKEKGKKG